MIHLELGAARIFVRPGATDLRKQINGLVVLVLHNPGAKEPLIRFEEATRPAEKSQFGLRPDGRGSDPCTTLSRSAQEGAAWHAGGSAWRESKRSSATG